MSADVLFAVDTVTLALAAGIGGQRHAPALPDQPLPKGFVGSQRRRSRGRIGTAALVEKDCLPCDGTRVALALHRGA